MRAHQALVSSAVAVTAIASVLTAPVGVASLRPARSRSPSIAAPTRALHVRGRAIGYRSFGHGTPIVLIEGYGVTMDDWDPRFLDLLAQQHRVIEFDNRGIGRSNGSVAHLSMDTLADDAAALIRSLHLGRPAVLGHSMGGSVAQDLTIRHPRVLSKLVLVASMAPGAGYVPGGAQEVRRLSPPYDSRTILDLLFSSPAARRAYVAACDKYRGRETVPVAVQAAQITALAKWLSSRDAWTRLAAVRTPTLVAVGTNDRLVPPANGEHLARHIPHSKLVSFRGGRHDFFMEWPRRFISTLDRFLTNR